MKVLGIDPGPVSSGIAWYDTETQSPYGFQAEMRNLDVKSLIDTSKPGYPELVVIEMIHSYSRFIRPEEVKQGKHVTVAADTYRTCFWAGRFAEQQLDRWGKVGLVYRPEVCKHWTGNNKAKKPQVNAAIRSRYGVTGVRPKKGHVLYECTSHAWDALAAIHTFIEGGIGVRENEGFPF